MMGYYERGGDGGMRWRSGPIPNLKALKEHQRAMEPVYLMYPDVNPEATRLAKQRRAARARRVAKAAEPKLF